jgi:methionyl-tRNA synthetase
MKNLLSSVDNLAFTVHKKIEWERFLFGGFFMEQITFDDFKKLDIRIGTILTADAVPETDKLIHLTVDTGQDEPRHIVAGLKDYYKPETMVGKQIAVVVNLAPRRMRGIMSNGMLLAASTDNFEMVKLLTVDEPMPSGSRVS